MQLLLHGEDALGRRTIESKLIHYEIRLLKRTSSGGYFEITITRCLPKLVINEKVQTASGHMTGKTISFKAHCSKDPEKIPDEESLIAVPEGSGPTTPVEQIAKSVKQMGKCEWANCASQYASEPIHLKMHSQKSHRPTSTTSKPCSTGS